MTGGYSTTGLKVILRSIPVAPALVSRTWNTIKELGINRRPRWKRGGLSHRNKTQARRNAVLAATSSSYGKQHLAPQAPEDHQIPVITGIRGCIDGNLDKRHRGEGVNKNNLMSIQCVPFELQLQACLLNAHSVGNTASKIMDFIYEQALDMMFLTETWLRPGPADQRTIGNMCPPGYSVLHQPRSTGRGGGVGVIFRDTIKTNNDPVTRTYQSFEHMPIKVVASSFTYRFIIIY